MLVRSNGSNTHSTVWPTRTASTSKMFPRRLTVAVLVTRRFSDHKNASWIAAGDGIAGGTPLLVNRAIGVWPVSVWVRWL
jgi:hypothetical protein